MFDIPLRSLKDSIFEPLSKSVPSFITPNSLTALAFLSGLLSCYSAALPSPGAAVSFWLLNRVLDCLDGSLARARGISSSLGGFLDILSDFVIYSLIPLAVSVGQDQSQAEQINWRAIAVLEASFHINNFMLFYVAAIAAGLKGKAGGRLEGELTSVSMRPALIEGAESGIIFTAMLAFPAYVEPLAWGMSALVAVGIVQRVGWLLPVLKRVDEEVKEINEDEYSARSEKAR